MPLQLLNKPCRYSQPRDLGECVGCSDQRGCINNLVKTWQSRAKDSGTPFCGQVINYLDNLAVDREYANFAAKNPHLVDLLTERIGSQCGLINRPRYAVPRGRPRESFFQDTEIAMPSWPWLAGGLALAYWASTATGCTLPPRVWILIAVVAVVAAWQMDGSRETAPKPPDPVPLAVANEESGAPPEDVLKPDYRNFIPSLTPADGTFPKVPYKCNTDPYTGKCQTTGAGYPFYQAGIGRPLMPDL